MAEFSRDHLHATKDVGQSAEYVCGPQTTTANDST
jgi:hypothetical protein